MESSANQSKEQPSSKPFEYAEEIDISSSDEEKSIGSDDEGDAIKRELTAKRTSRETLEKILDHSSGVCSIGPQPSNVITSTRL